MRSKKKRAVGDYGGASFGKCDGGMNLKMLKNGLCLVLFVGLGWLSGAPALAGVFTTVQYLSPGESSLGFEPEFVLSSGAGLGANLRFSRGIDDLLNGSFLIGTGTGPRQFRVGGVLSADFFPDIEGQPGIGLGLGAHWARVSLTSAGTGITESQATATQGRFDLALMPYLHNRFANPGGDVDPYVSIPLGFSIRDGRYQTTSSIAVGSFFHRSASIMYSMELNVGMKNSETSLAGGMVYTFR
jgi:hypothetical protein